tara:strand:+ start:379 stop:861 length:483 start_codon:yes stop_codon:yes gene_type:complete
MLKSKLTPEEIEVRIWGFVVVMITIILAGIVFALLYSVTFVVQPIKSMAPIDQAYTKMLNDIVLLIVGGIGGIVGKRAVGAVTNAINPPATPPSTPISTPVTTPTTSTWTAPSSAMPVWVNPPLDETWTPPPPPTTPPTHLEPDSVREEIALARKEGQYA